MQSFDILKQSIEDNKLGHALLLHGPDLGALSRIAESLSAQILETDNAYSHPDFFTLRPSGKARYIKIGSKDERNKGVWPENTMRRLIDDLQKTSNQGGNKVAIVYEAERMNIEAANAFLKTLEEPPEGTYLFILSISPYSVIDTIKSRCLHYRIHERDDFNSLESWEEWKQTYWSWISSLIKGYDRSKLCDNFFGFYGMIIKLQKTIESYRELLLEKENDKIDRTLSPDEKSALEVGIERSIRERLFSEIEDLTNSFVKKLAKENADNYLIKPLEEITLALEKSTGLLKLNFNSSSAIELYFLRSLRIWSSASRLVTNN